MKQHLTDLFGQALRAVAPDADAGAIVLERPKQAAHGDFSCNVAMQLARSLKRNPRDIATALLQALPPSPWVAKAEIAGAGFINVFLSPASKQRIVPTILEQGEAFGRSTMGKGRKVQVEFVSANPTGPLHVGHGRGAAFGMSLASVLAAASFDVHREYYINDAGRQMDILALSTWLRYLELNGISIPFPANGYLGDYVRLMATEIHRLHGDRYVHQPWTLLEGVPPRATEEELEREEKAAKQRNELHLDGLIANAKKLLAADYAYLHDYVLTEQLGDCRNDLMEFGVTFDTWFSERSLFDSGMVQRTVETLDRHGHLYRQDGALWFRSTAFGDEKDRVVQRENGEYTYFASDIAYHLNKFERGFERMINIWGADHHGYIPRVKGALRAMDLDESRLEIALVQFAVLYRGGEKIPMSTRKGEFVTLRQLRDEVGNDACRFFYVLRKSDQHLDFDLELAKSQSNDNPVYYVQYAHARICSVLAEWGGDINDLREADPSLLTQPHELALLQRLEAYAETIEDAAREFAPHYIAYYLKDLAGELHSYYNAHKFLIDDEPTKIARLALITATRHVLRSGLSMLGVSSPEKM